MVYDTSATALRKVTVQSILDASSFIESGDNVSALRIDSLDIGSTDTTITRDAAGQIAVEGAAVFTHASGTYTSAKITYSTSAPTGGSNGDLAWIWRRGN